MAEMRVGTAPTAEGQNSLPQQRAEASEGGLDGLTDGWMETFWMDEARRRHIRLPSFTAMPTTGKMERWLKRLGMSVTTYYALSGTMRLRQFMIDNPGRPLVEWVGIVLEWQSKGKDWITEVAV